MIRRITRGVCYYFITIYFNLLKYGTHLNDMANPRTGDGPISSNANPEPRNPTINRGVLSFCNKKKEVFFICYHFLWAVHKCNIIFLSCRLCDRSNNYFGKIKTTNYRTRIWSHVLKRVEFMKKWKDFLLTIRSAAQPQMGDEMA